MVLILWDKLPELVAPVEYDNMKILRRITMDTDIVLEEVTD
jgi:hypothetical protein